MKTDSKKQRPPFQAAPELLLPQLVDEQTYVQLIYNKLKEQCQVKRLRKEHIGKD